MDKIEKEFRKLGGGDRQSCPCKYKSPRRLYIREGPRGKQKFVPWGITCIHCGFVRSKQPIRVSKRQIAWELGWDKFQVEKMSNEEFWSWSNDWRQKTTEDQIKILLSKEESK